MVVVGVVLMVFIILGYVVYRNFVKSNDLKIHIDGTRVANHVADSINTVNVLGDGYSTTSMVPGTLYGGRPYTVNFYENESAVYLMGSGFSTGSELTFSSPLYTSQIECLLPGCASGCNQTGGEQCLQVNDSMTVKLTGWGGSVYLSPKFNVEQQSLRGDVVSYTSYQDPDPFAAEGFVLGEEVNWNVMYVHENVDDGSLSLVFSLNLSGEGFRADVEEVLGERVEFGSNDDLDEFNMDVVPGADEGRWSSGGGDVDGGYVKYAGGFRVCVQPETMPSVEWRFLSSDGNHLTLYDERVCVTYP